MYREAGGKEGGREADRMCGSNHRHRSFTAKKEDAATERVNEARARSELSFHVCSHRTLRQHLGHGIAQARTGSVGRCTRTHLSDAIAGDETQISSMLHEHVTCGDPKRLRTGYGIARAKADAKADSGASVINVGGRWCNLERCGGRRLSEE